MSSSPSTQPLPEELSLNDQGDTNDKFGYIIANDYWYEVPIGETKIGCDVSCSIVLDDETVSKEHAIIESEGAEDTFIYDVGSTNKTKMGKMTLRPHCRYKINDGDIIKLGNINIKFRVTDYKIKNRSSTIFQELGNIGEDTFPLQKKSLDLPDANKTSPTVNRINNANKTDIFKSPSMILKEKMKHVNKYYYVSSSESSPAEDIFSQATQCEVTGSRRDISVSSNVDQQYGIDDDIYNLSTQCEYAGDMLKKNDENSPEFSIMKNNASAKPREVIRCDFNDSGTFDFVNRKETKNDITFFTHESPNDDIFELATQCQIKLSDSINENELNFKNIVNKPENFAENLTIKLKTNSSNHQKLSLTNDDTNNEEINLTSLIDGNEEVNKLIRMSSTVINKSNNQFIFKNNSSGIVQNELSDEIFMVSTQVSEITNENDDNKCTKKLILNENYTDHNNTSKIDKLSETVKYHRSEEQESVGIVNNASQLKKTEEVTCMNKLHEVRQDEDMILTQEFRFSHHIPKENSKNIDETKDDEFVAKTFEGGDDSEDLKATQLFEERNLANLRGKHNNNNDIVHHSQDEIVTQIFPSNNREENQRNNSEANNKQVLSVTIQDIPPNPVPEFVFSDSGDETESDLEIKLCMESSLSKEEEKKLLFVKQEPESSSKGLHELDSPKRSSSVNSDKTVSDLDVAELQESNSALLERNNIEDFISTQIFPSLRNKSKMNLFGQKSTVNNEKNLNMTTKFKDIDEETRKRRECEDFIPTQAFPMAEVRKTQTVKCEKSESNITKDIRSATDHETIQVSTVNDFITEEDSNESESLLKDLEDFYLTNRIFITKKACSKPSPRLEENEPESSLTLSPSHPAYEALTEIDELIGNNGKTSDKSDSGIGSENFSEKYLVNEKELQKKIESDSDETDCEEELKKLGKQETFLISNLNILDNKSPLITACSEDVKQTTSNQTSPIEIDKSDKMIKRSMKNNICPMNDTKSKDSVNLDKGNESPMKRVLLRNSDEGVQKKRIKSVQKRKKKNVENSDLDDLILTQSLKLRNRVIRQRKVISDGGSMKKKAMTDMKASRKDKLLMGSDLGSSIESVSCVKISKEKTSAIRKLMEEFQTIHEGNSKQKKDIQLESKEMNVTVTKIAFTGFESDCHDKIIINLGGEKLNNLNDVHVLVSDRVRRTVKFLSAMALGLPIVSPKWLLASAKEMKFLNPWDFLLEDKSSEERWGFNLKMSLEKWRKQKLLNGYTVFATESTRPPVHEILSIVKCCGGLPVTSSPQIWPEKSIVLTCVEDKNWWPSYKWRYVKIVHYEFLLSGVLKHFMDFKTYKLR